MKIETKYSIGEDAWFHGNNYEPMCLPIIRIDLQVTKTNQNIEYWLDNDKNGRFHIINQTHLFKTQEELIQSIVG